VTGREVSQRLRTVVETVDADTRILLDRRLSLEEAPEALRQLAAGHAKGKTILAAETLSA